MLKRPTDIRYHKVKQNLGVGTEPFNAQLGVDKQGRSFGACQQVVQIIGAGFKIAHIALQLSVHSVQFFVEGLHLFLRSF